MLYYFNEGRRNYPERVNRVNQRPYWEFQAVIKGYLGLKLANRTEAEFFQKTLFLFPPDTGHNWVCRKDQSCSILVMHFDGMFPSIAEHAHEKGYLHILLTERQIKRLCQLGAAVKPHYARPTTHSFIYYEKALSELALYILAAVPERRLDSTEQNKKLKVDQAVNWFIVHMPSDPSIEELAAAIHLSPTHLRRLFHAVLNEPPLKTLNRLRMAKTKELLSQTDMPLWEIAQAAGFSEASPLCRAFKSAAGMSPGLWREKAERQKARAVKEQAAGRQLS